MQQPEREWRLLFSTVQSTRVCSASSEITSVTMSRLILRLEFSDAFCVSLARCLPTIRPSRA